MDTASIISAVDAELESLYRVRNILRGHDGVFTEPAFKVQRKWPVLSAKARKAISDAQKRRWAKQKAAAK